MTHMKKWVATVLAMLLLAMMLPTAAFATQGFENNNCLVFVSEPGETSPYVSYYKDGSEQSTEAMTWVDDGVHGKALSLNGTSEYLQIGYYQLRMSQMTFSTWINFRGTVDSNNPAGAYWQRLFTIAQSDECYFTVSPHAVDATVSNEEGTQLDGVYMEYYRGYSAQDGQEYSMKSFSDAKTGYSSFGLPQNEWHHMAVVVDSSTVKLYVDGNLILEELFLMPIVQMSADSMLIGGGRWSDPLLHALLDDTLLFDKALSAEQIAALMQTGDVASIDNAAAVVTTSTIYEPTTTTTDSLTEPTEVPEDKPFAPFGLPVWGFAVVVGLLAVIIVLTVIVNLYESHWRKAQNPTPTVTVTEDEDEAPAMSIKEAALQKRREEHERFLAQEQQEQEQASETDET